jgi:flavin reductase (DIM6/NTAB) family NADH-FMN oxidoreductase RutF
MMHGAAIDSKRFRSVMGSFPTGVAVIGIECDGELFCATINSLTSLRRCCALGILFACL